MTLFEDLKLGAIILVPVQPDTLASPLPLERTQVHGTLVGPVASVTVTQWFGNPYTHPIELEYLFPLPEKGAVVDYEITIGKRTIKADVQEREKARQTYQQAVSEGKRASLLEQRRPNLFSIQIGNVQPGEHIRTMLRYEDRLRYVDGAYEFVFPMGITPRYHTPTTSVAEAASVSAPVDLDDAQISPVEIEITVDAGVSTGDATSRTHPIQVTRTSEREFAVALEGRQIPNKDFVLQYEVGDAAIRAAVWSSKDEDGAETALVSLLPPRLDATQEPPPREFIFVIDRSGSMSTDPMEQAKNALRACIRALGENDTFTIEAFDDQREWFSQRALPVTQENVTRADGWIADIHSRGGTEILTALTNALQLPADPERQRYLVFLTDGAVSAENQVLKEISQMRGNARLFTFGIGPSVNRYLLAKMAEIGRGSAQFMGAQDDIEAAMTRFQDKVSYPALLDVKCAWEGAESWDTYPAVLPDLYVGEPLELAARLSRKGEVTLKVTGTRQREVVEMSVVVPTPQETNPILRRIWARARVESLTDEMRVGGDAEAIRQQIISLGLAHRLVTPYTSFVAVDSEVTDSGEQARRVHVAVPLPEGLDPEGFFGDRLPVGYGGAHSSIAPVAAPPPAMYETHDYFEVAPSSRGGGVLDWLADKVDSLFDRGVVEERLGSYMDSEVAHSVGPSVETAPALGSIGERLKWLARTQQVNGSWGDDVEMTAAALLAFVRAGHTTRTGNYRRQVSKAATWLQSQVGKASGFARFAAVRALDELCQAAGDFAVPDTVRSKLPPPSSAAERAALGEGAVPGSVASLDDLRVTALLRGEASAPDKLASDPKHRDLVQVWLAVGKPQGT